jgi:hypothetical protein
MTWKGKLYTLEAYNVIKGGHASEYLPPWPVVELPNDNLLAKAINVLWSQITDTSGRFSV